MMQVNQVEFVLIPSPVTLKQPHVQFDAQFDPHETSGQVSGHIKEMTLTFWGLSSRDGY